MSRLLPWDIANIEQLSGCCAICFNGQQFLQSPTLSGVWNIFVSCPKKRFSSVLEHVMGLSRMYYQSRIDGSVADQGIWWLFVFEGGMYEAGTEVGKVKGPCP